MWLVPFTAVNNHGLGLIVQGYQYFLVGAIQFTHSNFMVFRIEPVNIPTNDINLMPTWEVVITIDNRFYGATVQKSAGNHSSLVCPVNFVFLGVKVHSHNAPCWTKC